MKKLEYQIDDFLKQIMQFSENKREILLGSCESDVSLTGTQEHILMLLKNGQQNNREMADELKISPAAVTKALKKLQELNLITAVKSDKDERVIFWNLTEKAEPFAAEHAHHHEKTLETYRQIVSEFDENQQATIATFIEKLAKEIR